MEKCLSPFPPFSDFLRLDSEKDSKSMSLLRPLLLSWSKKEGVASPLPPPPSNDDVAGLDGVVTPTEPPEVIWMGLAICSAPPPTPPAPAAPDTEASLTTLTLEVVPDRMGGAPPAEGVTTCLILSGLTC